MKIIITLSMLVMTLLSCSEQAKNNSDKTADSITFKQQKMIENPIDNNLPTIGILIFEGVIINEVVAPLDVFSNQDIEGKHLFNVITIASKKNK